MYVFLELFTGWTDFNNSFFANDDAKRKESVLKYYTILVVYLLIAEPRSNSIMQ